LAPLTSGGKARSVSSNPGSGQRIYHLALQAEWQEALERGAGYRRSTLGRSLEDVGFIHCSLASQVGTIADLVYRDRDDVVLLVIDRARLPAPVRMENLDGGDELFPHVYDVLPVAAVIRADPVPLGDDGRLAVASLVTDD